MEDFTIDTIIPAYNGTSFMVDTITSVEARTYKPSRIIFVNEGFASFIKKLIQ